MIFKPAFLMVMYWYQYQNFAAFDIEITTMQIAKLLIPNLILILVFDTNLNLFLIFHRNTCNFTPTLSYFFLLLTKI